MKLEMMERLAVKKLGGAECIRLYLLSEEVGFENVVALPGAIAAGKKLAAAALENISNAMEGE